MNLRRLFTIVIVIAVLIGGGFMLRNYMADRANELMTGTLLTMEIWITVTAMYLMLTLPCSVAIQMLEDRVARGLK